MVLLLAGFLVPCVALFGWGVVDGFSWLRYQRGDIAWLSVAMVAVPALGAWAAAELTNMVTPRRAFDRRRRSARARLVVGAIAGVLCAGLATGLLPLVDRYVSDALVFGATGTAAMLLCVVWLSRVRPGHCIHCGYDLRDSPAPGQPGSGRCPECGAETVARIAARRGIVAA